MEAVEGLYNATPPTLNDGQQAELQLDSAGRLIVVQTTAAPNPTGAATAANQTAEATLIGATNETAPATDTAASGLNGRLQRVAQRLTSLIAVVPAALGSAAAASSFAVALSTEDVARQGSVTETAPASDTASSGINGRLQRIAQRLTSLIGLASIAGPSSFHHLASAAGSTNATSVKASAANLFSVIGYNAASTIRYLHLYDKASAPTVGTDTPVMTLPLPPYAGFSFDFDYGMPFGTGLAYGLSTGAADNDSAAVTAADIVGLNMLYS